MALFKITITKSYQNKPDAITIITKEFYDTHQPNIPAKKWAEDWAYSFTDKGSKGNYKIVEIK